MPRFSPFAIYLTGLGSWFVPLGIQQVLFAWLAAIGLHMDAYAVGIAQMALMAPSILFLPLGASGENRLHWVAEKSQPRACPCQRLDYPELVPAGVLMLVADHDRVALSKGSADRGRTIKQHPHPLGQL